jgi:hypothetical protein
MNNKPRENPEILNPILTEKTEQEKKELEFNTLLELATDSKTSVDMLEELSKHENEHIRAGVTRNRQTPVRVLDFLSSDKSIMVIRGVASNPNTSLETLKKISEINDPSVLPWMAGNPNTSSDMLDKIVMDFNEYDTDDYFTIATIIGNPNISLETLLKFQAKCPLSCILSYDVGEVSYIGNERIRSKIVQHPDVTVEILSEYAKDTQPHIRCKVAGSNKTPISVLEKLSEDESFLVRMSVLYNPNTPEHIQNKIKQDPDPNIRFIVEELNTKSN